jgi:hypothetical protein
MSRSDSRPIPAGGYGFPSAVAQVPARIVGSPRTLDSSVAARPPHSPRAARCVHVLVTSASVTGFSISGSVAGCHWFNEAESGSLLLGSRLRSSRPSVVVRPAASPGRTDPFRVVGYPSTPDRSYMVNEQFTWLTPLSQRDESGFPWRTEATKTTKRNGAGSVGRVAGRRPLAGVRLGSGMRIHKRRPDSCIACGSALRYPATARSAARRPFVAFVVSVASF